MQRLNLRLDFELQLPTEQSVKEQSEQGIGGAGHGIGRIPAEETFKPQT